MLGERIKIGAHVRSLRKRTGMAQEAFAHAAGLSRKQMYRIENADQSVGIDQYIKVFLALHLSLSSVLAESDAGSGQPGAGSGEADDQSPAPHRP